MSHSWIKRRSTPGKADQANKIMGLARSKQAVRKRAKKGKVNTADSKTKSLKTHPGAI